MFTKTEKELLKHFNIGAVKQSTRVTITSPLDIIDVSESKTSSNLSDFIQCESDYGDYGTSSSQPIMEFDFSNAMDDYKITKDGHSLMSTAPETLQGDLKRTIETFKRAEDLENAGFKLEMVLEDMGEASATIPIIYAETGVHLIIPKASNDTYKVVEGKSFHGNIRAFKLTSPNGDTVYVEGNKHGQIRDMLKMQYNMLKTFTQVAIKGIDYPTELPVNAPKEWSMRFNGFNEPVCRVSDDDAWILVKKDSLTQLHNMMSDQLGDARFEYLDLDEETAVKAKISGRFPSEGSKNFDKIIFDVVKECNPNHESHPLLNFVSFGNEDEVEIYETEHYIIWNVL